MEGMMLARLSLLSILFACGVAHAQDVGETRWIKRGSVIACPQPRAADVGLVGCFSVNHGGMTVEGTAPNRVGITSLLVRFDDGRRGYIDSGAFIVAETRGERASAAAASKACERRGGVGVGMTRDQLYASCWGRPARINVTITAEGRREQLVYRGRNYVYLTDGVVTAIQTAE
jgi:hypothetical protein